MTKHKLPPSDEWESRDIEDWNVRTFHSYMQDKHEEMFGCQYVPHGSWQREQGMLGRLIGTQRKKGTHDKAMIKRFIDEAFKTYKPTKQYPGTNFGFIYTYRRNILQALEAEESRKKEREEKRKKSEKWAKEIKENQEEHFEDLAEWF